MTDFKTLAEAVERDRENGTPGPWVLHKKHGELEIGSGPFDGDGWPKWNVATCWSGMADGVQESNSTRIARLPDLETAFLELWARVQELEAKGGPLGKL